MDEEWRDVVGFEGLYQISSLGRVMSFSRSKEGRLLRPGLTSAGYPSVSLGRNKTKLVHALIAEAFLGPRKEGHEVLHIDGNRANSVLTNIRYGTRKENIEDSRKHGTFKKGVLSKRKISLDLESQIRYTYYTSGCTHKDLAAMFKISSRTVYKALRRKYAPLS